jgi:hypothetical protein
MKLLLFKLSAVLFGLALGFCGSELLVRMVAPQPTHPSQFSWDPDLGAIPVPRQHGRRIIPGILDFSYTNNSIGLRGSREYQYTKSTEYRLLFLGDSFTYGHGVDDNDTFASLVETNLHAWGLQAEVINAGVSGTGTEYALNFFLKRGLRYRPDIVSLFFMTNDFVDNANHRYYTVTPENTLIPRPLGNDFIQSKQWLTRIPFYQWLISWSHVTNLIKRAIIEGLAPAPQIGGRDAIRGFLNPSDEEARYTSILLDHLRDSVNQQGAKFVVFYIPSNEEVEATRRTGSVSPAESLALSLAGGVYPATSLTPMLAGTSYISTALYFQEGHWTVLAHRIAAERISATLRDLLSAPHG